MSDDHSPGDGRKPYADRGGPEARHAETHDVRREKLTNPKGPEPEDTSFAEQLAPYDPGMGGHVDESVPAADDKVLRNRLTEISGEELDRLSVIVPGTRLEQGSVYVDLNRLGDGPFKALGSQEAQSENRFVAKRDTDYQLWNRLVGQEADVEIERPVES